MCLLTTFVTGQYFVFSDIERLQRVATYDNDFMDLYFTETHQKEIGDDVAANGFPDDGNGRYT